MAKVKGKFFFSVSMVPYGLKLIPFDRTFIAFDTLSAGPLLAKMKRLGVNIGSCGKEAVRLRPMLVFDEQHGL